MEKLWILLILLHVCSYASVESMNQEELENTVDSFVDALRKCRDVIAMNLVVAQNDNILLSKAYGVVDLNSSRNATTDTLFGIGSITKGLNNLLLAKVLQQSHRNLTWDSKLRDILNPAFSDPERQCYSSIRDLAAHRMGFPAHNFLRYQNVSRPELLKRLRFLNHTSEFRNSYVYSNILYGVIAHVTETIAGSGDKSWEDLMRELIFAPLQMDNTTFQNEPDLFEKDIARPYRMYGGRVTEVPQELLRLWGLLGGAGSIMTNAKDMGKYLLYLLKTGQQTADGRVPADKELLDELYSPVIVLPRTSSSKFYTRPTLPVTYFTEEYGLGWRSGFYRGYVIHLHTGSTWGYYSLITLVPAFNIAIFTAISGADAQYYTRRVLHFYIMDLMLSETPWLNLTTACTFPEPWQTRVVDLSDFASGSSITLTSNPDNYIGTYGNYLYGNLSVWFSEGNSLLILKYGDLAQWTLTATSNVTDPTEFYGEWDMMFLSKVMFYRQIGSQQFDRVKIYDFEPKDPPVFLRGLQMPSDDTDGMRCNREIPSKASNGRVENVMCVVASVLLSMQLLQNSVILNH